MSETVVPSATAAPIQVTPSEPASTSAPAAAPEWTSGFDDSLKGYIQTKGFKTPNDLANSYLNLEKMHGVPQDRLLKLPENMDTPEGRAIWEKLGAPKEAKDYQLEVPKEFGDPKMAEVFSQKFAELGVPKGMAQKIVAAWNEYTGSQRTAMTETMNTALVQEQTALKKEWGAAHDQNIQIGKEAAKKFGFDGPVIDKLESAMGYQGVMKFMAKLGTSVGEHSYISGSGGGSFGDMMSPSGAKSKMDSLLADPTFKGRYLAGDTQAKSEMNKLAAMAFPGDATV